MHTVHTVKTQYFFNYFISNSIFNIVKKLTIGNEKRCFSNWNYLGNFISDSFDDSIWT